MTDDLLARAELAIEESERIRRERRLLREAFCSVRDELRSAVLQSAIARSGLADGRQPGKRADD